MSPTLSQLQLMPASQRVFSGRRNTTDVNPSMMAGLRMREQQQVLKDQIYKNQLLENRIKRLAFEQ